jgi:putative hydrolase of the HAD superfamily
MLHSHVAHKMGITEEKLKGIKNIIFDLGGVIIEIHFQGTKDQFKKIGFNDFDNIYSQMKQTHLFDQLETGKIQPKTFRNELRKYNPQLTDEQIDYAWNHMIGEMPESNITLLKEVRKHYRTFLFSNTNAIHIKYFNQYLQRKFGHNPLPEMFEHAYYSFEMGKRKPDVEAYAQLLSEAGLKANETMFIDDLEINVEGAKSAGIAGYCLKDETIANLFKI